MFNDPLHRTSRDMQSAAQEGGFWHMVQDTTATLNWDRGAFRSAAISRRQLSLLMILFLVLLLMMSSGVPYWKGCARMIVMTQLVIMVPMHMETSNSGLFLLLLALRS